MRAEKASATAREDALLAETSAAELAERVIRLMQDHAAKSEDVGERFPEEARRIHRGEAEERGIRGTASKREVFELWEEGVSVLPIPPSKDSLH